MKLRLIPFVIIFFVVAQLYPGSDLMHHLHHAWLYNQMLVKSEIITHDPGLLGGEQFVFTYGVPVYFFASLLYPLLSFLTVDFLMLVTNVFLLILFADWFKNDKLVTILFIPF